MPVIRLKKLLTSPVALVATILVAGFVVLAVIAPAVWGGRAESADPAGLLAPPSAAHPFGTDSLGRDVLARTLVATRLSLGSAVLATVISAVVGVLVGALPAVLGRRVQRWSAAIINTWLAFPTLLLAMLIVLALGTSVQTAMVALVLTMVPSFARLTQTLAARTAGQDWVAAGRLLGLSRRHQFVRYILPDIAEPFVVNVALSISGALLAMSSLSFLGVGVQLPDYDWGRLLNEGFGQVYSSPMAAVGPGLFVVLAGLAFGLLGESIAGGLRRSDAGAAVVPRRGEGAPPQAVDHVAEPPLHGPAGRPDHSATRPLLAVEDLTVSFRDGAGGWRTPVRGVSFSVAPGEIVGLVGESGSGKSITVMAVADLLPAGAYADARRIEFDGHALPGLPEARKRQVLTGMGIIFQDSLTSLNPAMRIGPQLTEALIVHQRMSGRAALDRAIEELDRVGLDPSLHVERRFPHELSGGMRQRVLIAMAQIIRPRLIIADEPTTALDVTVQRQVLAVLRNECARDGQAAVIVSHDIAVLGQLCSRILVMYQGRLVENFETSLLRTPDLLEHPYTRALVAAVPTVSTDRTAPLATVGDLTEVGA